MHSKFTQQVAVGDGQLESPCQTATRGESWEPRTAVYQAATLFHVQNLTVLCYHPYLVSLPFTIVLSLHHVTFLMLLLLVMLCLFMMSLTSKTKESKSF